MKDPAFLSKTLQPSGYSDYRDGRRTDGPTAESVLFSLTIR